MKMHLIKKTSWQFILSGLTLAVFVFLAVSSAETILGLNIPKTENVRLSDGRWQETFYTVSQKRTTTGKRNAQGNWTGEVTVVWTGGSYGYTEKCTMLNGKRILLSTRTYNYSDYYGPHKEETWYADNMDMPNYKAAHGHAAEVSAYKVLGDTYSWYLASLVACGFDSAYVEAYLDTLETLLNTYEFEVSEFDSYYEDVLGILEDTPYDSLIVLNTDLFLYQGLQEIKNSELRLAVIDHYNSEGSSTFQIISTTYPDYLQSMNDSGIVSQDFEKFCQDLDDSLAGYGPLNWEDPAFIDSVDSRLFRALYSIIAVDLPSSQAALSLMNSPAGSNDLKIARKPFHITRANLAIRAFKSTSSEVATVVASFMLAQFVHGDIMRYAVRESYFIQKGIVHLAAAATGIPENISATAISLPGYVIKDGGSAITSRGICWATIYNPDLEDNIVASGSGTGEFAVTLDGLTEGTLYYARTYATNSSGTAYGNCISFVAAVPTDIDDSKLFTGVFAIYPNPSSAITTFSFQLESPENVLLNILDMKGQQIYCHIAGRLPKGINRFDLDLNTLPNGMYNCQLTNGKSIVTHKLVIAH
jgi:hypothetical protein